MQSMYFTEEHQLFRNSLKDFLQKEVVPHIDKWEETGTIERFIWKKFGDMGYFGLATPEEDGGLGLDLFYTIILLEELQKINVQDNHKEIEEWLNEIRIFSFIQKHIS